MTNEIFIPLDVSKTIQSLPRDEAAELIDAIDSLEAVGPKNAVRIRKEHVADEAGSGLFQIRSGSWLITFRYRPENKSIIISSLTEDATPKSEIAELYDESGSPRAFLHRVGAAFLRLIALGMLGGAHWLLERLTAILVRWSREPFAGVLLNDISFVIFLLIYLYLLWDIVRIFIPALTPKSLANQRSTK
jgi:hypothetical protein